MNEKGQTARCVNCRSDVSVPDSYAEGDHIKCGICGTQHKVRRGEVLRLVLADVTPLQEALRDNQLMVERLEDELRGARGSFGIGANGMLIGVAYVVWQVARRDRELSLGLGWEFVATAVVSGIILEILNFFFMAKRQRITRLNAEIDEARAEGRALQQKIRDAARR